MRLLRFVFLSTFLISGAATGQPDGWELQQSSTTTWLHAVDFISPTTGWAVGEYGLILKSTNGGITWSPIHTDSALTFLAVDFLDMSGGFVVGYDTAGFILRTTDGGSTWDYQSLSGGLVAVQFVSTTVGWVISSEGTVFKTTDGGSTWMPQTLPEPFIFLTSMYFLDENAGWIAGQIPGVVFKTTDGGSLWETVDAGLDPGSAINAIFFIDENVGWAVGYNKPDTVGIAMIMKTTDGGSTWFEQMSGSEQYLLSVAFSDLDTGWAVGGGGIILTTTDGGATWVDESSGLTNELGHLQVRTGEGAWTVGEGGVILRKNFGGLPALSSVSVALNNNWNMVCLPMDVLDASRGAVLPSIHSPIFAYDQSAGYVMRETLMLGEGYWVRSSGSQVIDIVGLRVDSLSINLKSGWNLIGGMTEDVPVTSIIQDPPNSIRSVFGYEGSYMPATVLQPGKAYWIRSSQECRVTLLAEPGRQLSRVHHTNPDFFSFDELPPAAPGEISNEVETERAVPAQYGLGQNYPNPFNPATRIIYDLPEESVVRLSVFNTLGQEIAILVSGIQAGGSHSIEWNGVNGRGASLSSGVYLYRLHAESVESSREFNQVRKMVLMW